MLNILRKDSEEFLVASGQNFVLSLFSNDISELSWVWHASLAYRRRLPEIWLPGWTIRRRYSLPIAIFGGCRGGVKGALECV